MLAREMSRRGFLTQSAHSLECLAATLLVGEDTPLPAAEPEHTGTPARPLSVVCVGAHPDDPESGCGGTLARYAGAGHRVTVIYLTRGEAGIAGKSHAEAATIRSAECAAACQILGAKPAFAGQIDGATEVNRDRSQSLLNLLTAVEPDLVFTHWPLDTHPDHQAASLLTFRAYLSGPRRFLLYFFEVNTGSQSLGFTPNVYVDTTATREKRKAALCAHRSQDGEAIYRRHHEIIETFRGREMGVASAEAFVALPRDGRRTHVPGL
jgi:LmbE family N-acetylglucosaminyl deacetylase